MAGFVEGPCEAEADRPVEVDGGFILGGDFEVSPFDTGFAETEEAFGDQCPAESESAVFGGDADVLNRTHDATGDDGLNRATVDGFFVTHAIPGDEPGTAGQEVALRRDITHQFATAVDVSQAGKDAGVEFGAEAVVLGDGVTVERGQFPGTPAVAFRQRIVYQARVEQVDFHAESTKVCFGEVHEKLAAARGVGSKTDQIFRVPNFTILYTSVNLGSSIRRESADFPEAGACRG